jgi:hypothetical protein
MYVCVCVYTYKVGSYSSVRFFLPVNLCLWHRQLVHVSLKPLHYGEFSRIKILEVVSSVVPDNGLGSEHHLLKSPKSCTGLFSVSKWCFS